MNFQSISFYKDKFSAKGGLAVEAGRRRAARAGYARGRRAEAEWSFREMLVQQCVVSGVILLMALAVSFLPVGFAADIRAGLRNALASEVGPDGLLEAAGGIPRKYGEFRDSIKGMFGGQDALGRGGARTGIEYSPGAGIPAGGGERAAQNTDEVPAQEGAEASPAEKGRLSGNGARIDESILSGMDGGAAYGEGGGEKKQ